MINKKYFFVLLVLSLFITSNIFAETVVLQSQTDSAKKGYWAYDASQTYMSSSFISSFTDDVNTITVKLGTQKTAQNWDITMTIETISSGETPTNPRNIIATSTNTINASTFTGTPTAYDFNFNDNVFTCIRNYAWNTNRNILLFNNEMI